MKKKALIASILLGLTLVLLAGYFLVGCSTIQDRLARLKEQANKEVAVSSKNERHLPVSNLQVTAQPTPEKPKSPAEALHQDIDGIIAGVPVDGPEEVSLRERDRVTFSAKKPDSTMMRVDVGDKTEPEGESEESRTRFARGGLPAVALVVWAWVAARAVMAAACAAIATGWGQHTRR